MAGVKDITIKLSGDAAGLASAFRSAEQVAGRFKGSMDQFARQYRSTMAAAFDKGAADRMAQNLFGSIEGMRNRLLAQAKQLKGIFSDADIVGVQGKFKNAGANEFKIKDGASAAFNMAAATGQSIDKVGALLAKSLQGANKELAKLVPEVANLTVEELKAGAAIDLVAKKYAGFGDAANAALKKAELTSKLKDMGDRMSSVGRSMSLYVTAPLVAAGGASIKYASDVNESINKVDVAFGKHGALVKQFSDNALQSYGISRGSAMDMAATYGDMATSMGLSTAQAAKMSTVLTGLAGDMSSFKNIPIAETSQALTAIFTGETESLKRMGVVMTEANLQAYALSKGIKEKVKDMSESEKVMLRYNYILEKTKNSQGDFARTAAGAANQQRTFGEGIKQLAASFGQALIPMWEKFLGLVNRLVAWLSNLSGTTKIIVTTVAALAAGIGPLMLGIGVFTSTVLPALIAGGTALQAAWAPVTAVVLALAGAFAYFAIKSQKAQEQVDKMAQSKYFKPLTAEYEANKKRIADLQKEMSSETSKGYSLNGVYVDPKAQYRHEIELLKERNTLLYKAIAAKKESVVAEAEAMQKAKDSADAMAAQLAAGTQGAEAAKETIATVYAKFEEAKQALDNQLANGVVASRGYYTELEGLANQYYKKVGEFSGAAKTKELEALKAFVEKAREMTQVSATAIASPYGAGSVGTIDPTSTKIERKGQHGNMIVGTANYGKTVASIKSDIKEMQQLLNSFTQSVKDGIVSALEGIGTMFGELARGNGKNALKNFLNGFIGLIADFAAQMGKMLISVGLGILAFETSLESMNPYVAIAAGAALIVAAAAFKSFVGGGVGGGGSRSGSTISRQTPRGSAATAQTSTSNAITNGQVVFKIKRGDLVGVMEYDGKMKSYAMG